MVMMVVMFMGVLVLLFVLLFWFFVDNLKKLLEIEDVYILRNVLGLFRPQMESDCVGSQPGALARLPWVGAVSCSSHNKNVCVYEPK